LVKGFFEARNNERTCPSSAKNRFVAAFAQGLLNFICYGLNDKLKQAWLQNGGCE